LSVEESASVGKLIVTDSILLGGDLNASKNVYIGKDLTVVDDLTVGGIFAVTGTMQVSDVVTIQDPTNSTSKDIGCLVLEGGLGIEKDCTIGGNLIFEGTETITKSGPVSLATRTTFIDSSGGPIELVMPKSSSKIGMIKTLIMTKNYSIPEEH